MGARRLLDLEAPGDVLIAAARRASGRARALRGRTRLGLARLDARGAGIGQPRRKGDQRRDLSVPRAVANVAPSSSLLQGTLSLPLAWERRHPCLLAWVACRQGCLRSQVPYRSRY